MQEATAGPRTVPSPLLTSGCGVTFGLPQFPRTGIFFLSASCRPPTFSGAGAVSDGNRSTLLSWVLLCSCRFQIPLASHLAFPQSSSLLPWWWFLVISEPPGMETKSSLDLFTSLSSWFLISDFSLILQLYKFFQNFYFPSSFQNCINSNFYNKSYSPNDSL